MLNASGKTQKEIDFMHQWFAHVVSTQATISIYTVITSMSPMAWHFRARWIKLQNEG
jgi:hypothetical protein